MNIIPSSLRCRAEIKASALMQGYRPSDRKVRTGCVDMHLHACGTKTDDGKFRPSEVVKAARFLDLSCIALTPHHRLCGVEGLETGNRIGQRVIPGVELTAESRGFDFHILGYFDPEIYSAGFEGDVNRSIETMYDIDPCMFLEFSSFMKDRASFVVEEDLVRESTCGSFGKILKSLPEALLPLLQEEAASGIAFLPNPSTVVDLIHSFGGKAVMAHPRWLTDSFLSYRMAKMRGLFAASSEGLLPGLPKGLTAIESLKWAKENLPQAHRQLMDGIDRDWLEQQYSMITGTIIPSGIDGIETHTPFTELPTYPELKRSFMKRDFKLIIEHGLHQTGGTDSHGKGRNVTSELMGIGIDYTFRMPKSMIDWLF